ncbi:hypothetical protein tinsulaeT_21110 [Thalassotalea insulae]|uniref:Protease n=1 Tax=Thalassotalea insulae TaxID=2056778 RepID=A0ABQ6GX72_9GAMM|nr:hypothetical protein [Thalassotalea insulae]GLX78771.1 hypothetical protein tinsulaeT_21110 [Thalassotalea insulae]
MFERFKAYWFTSLICILFFITFFAMSTTSHSILQCEISAEDRQQSTNGVTLSYILTNISAQPVKLLTWYTPLEGFMTDLFKIEDSQGHELAYQGPMVKRMTPSAEDYIVIEAQESVSINLNLQDAYPINVGSYQISLRPKMIQLQSAQRSLSAELCRNQTISINVK